MPHTPLGRSADELQGARPDPDPVMECDGCGGTWRASYYDRYGQLTANPEEPVLCASCEEKPAGARTVEERAETNHSITEFKNSDDET